MTAAFAFAPGLEDTSVVTMGTNRSGLAQLRRVWRAPDARAVVLIVHGIAEHSGRYEHVARQLVDVGMTVVCFDQRAHGKSEGQSIDSFDEFHDDVEDHLAEIGALDLPTILLGHSMGGLVVATYVLSDRPQPALVVLSAPVLAFAQPRWTWRPIVGVGGLLSRVRISLPLDPEELATDPRVAEVYAADPDVRLEQSLGLISAMASAAVDFEAQCQSWSHEALIVHGLDDKIVPPAASETLAAVATVDRQTYDGLRHELFNEPVGPQVVADVLAWIDRRL